MRISDWSSDVCSSDLEHVEPLAPAGQRGGVGYLDRPAPRLRGVVGGLPRHQPERARVAVTGGRDADSAFEQGHRDAVFIALHLESRSQCRDRAHRSEEHTSELQSLMRISYAVFCLKN